MVLMMKVKSQNFGIIKMNGRGGIIMANRFHIEIVC